MQEPKSKNKLIAFLTIVALAGVAGTGYFYLAAQKSKTDILISKQKPSPTPVDELKSILLAIGTVLELPKDETPTLATVTDPNALKDQPFFAKAKKGDKVIIYSKAGKAILYDPTTKKVIEVAPLSISSPTPSPTPQR